MQASEVESASFLRVLLMGGPKVGKTRTTLETIMPLIPKGKKAYVINCDDKFSLKPAARVTSNFEWDLIDGSGKSVVQQLEDAVVTAKKGVKEGKYGAVIWDTITYYAQRSESVFADATNNSQGEPDGRRFWPKFAKNLYEAVDRLLRLDAHVVVTAHYIDVKGAEIDNQLEKSGDGICPMLPGKSRATIPAMFQDVVFMEMKAGKRMFTTGSGGVWGPGCRNLEGVSQTEANFALLWEKMQAGAQSAKVSAKQK